MIGRLRGELLDVGAGVVVVDAGGVGYEVLVPESVMAQMPAVGEFVDLTVRQVFREDGVTLYGFLEAFQRRMFDLLTEVKGCGPKIGLSLLGRLGEDAIAGAILAQDARTLTAAPGVGPRLAERIILELKDKVQEETLSRKIAGAVRQKAVVATETDDLVEVLLTLGYKRQEAEIAARDARQQVGTMEEQLKYALRILAR
jgi:Holliday junction DNA helicase RuvA